MLVCTITESLSSFLANARSKRLSIGFAPTMGALHEGHLSLISAALKEDDIVISSVFVNRAQFNDKSDFDKYPRMPEKDLAMLEKAGCHVVYMPEEKEIFPPDWAVPNMDFGSLEEVMEGRFRPGHFKGMVKVVHRLFEIVQPDRAYFGEKDFQQLAIIRALARGFHPSVKVIGCPILREPDGLAMSSRNMLLTPEQRKEAPVVFETLKEAAQWLQKMPVELVKSKVEEVFSRTEHFKLQYFEVADEYTLLPVNALRPAMEVRLCIAVLSDGPRLIDNLKISI